MAPKSDRPLIITNPAGLHAPVGFGYSHVASVSAADLVLIGGQYGSGPDGHVTSTEFAEQVERSFANLGTALAAREQVPHPGRHQ